MSLRSIRAAVGFLTRIPVGGDPFSRDELRWAPAHFPLVGAAVGSVVGLIYVATLPWGSVVAAMLAVVGSLVLTGAFHEDGLADSADALGGGYSKEKVLEILKDSRLGTFGTVALVMSLSLRVVLLARHQSEALGVLIVIESLSRVPPVVVLTLIPYATRPEASKSRDLTDSGIEVALVACGWALLVVSGAIAAGVVRTAGVFGLAVVSITVTLALTRYMIGRVGGITGDFLGAIQQLVALALWLSWGAL